MGHASTLEGFARVLSFTPMSPRFPIPELLAPAGSVDAVRAAVANGANAVYLGAARFNARDEGAQLTLDELGEACAIAHAGGVRIYLTLNILLKPAELEAALEHLGEAIDRGVDAAIVQDLGLVRLIQRVYPGFEIHGSTQMTVHDTSGARVMRNLGVERVVLARENTLDDIRAIRAGVPELGLETFVHGALCISYSGQCLMSGMISERSANRGSCAQSCRKDYVLRDAESGDELDRGYLISAKDLAAHDQLPALAEIGIGCLKVEGRKKKPEYVATVTRGYRTFLDRVAEGLHDAPVFEEVRPLVQIFSRGNTNGMLLGRSGRDYITRDHPDNRGHEIGVVVAREKNELIVDVSHAIHEGDGLGFEPPLGERGVSVGFAVTRVRTLDERGALTRQSIPAREAVPVGWRVVRSADAALLQSARASFDHVVHREGTPRVPLDVRVFGSAGSSLKALFTAGENTIEVRSETPLAAAQNRALDEQKLREQFGRLGETLFVLRAVDVAALHGGLFLPVSELNRMRQSAVEELSSRMDWARLADHAERTARIQSAVSDVRVTERATPNDSRVAARATRDHELVAEVWQLDDARAAADAGATEVVFDPFLHHPLPPVSRLRTLSEELLARGVTTRLRTPTVVRPEDRKALQKWLDLPLPVLTGHVGLLAELSEQQRDAVGDYALNVFNAHTAAELFRLGASRLTSSVELTVEEIASLVAPWNGRNFEVLIYGRPEGMTIEHCVLSAAFDRVATTCRDLCVQKHPKVELTDPAGYTFPVATDAQCRNRLLHSRPIEASEYLPALWDAGVRSFRAVFNVHGDPISDIVRQYADALGALSRGETMPRLALRERLENRFTRGHFARAV